MKGKFLAGLTVLLVTVLCLFGVTRAEAAEAAQTAENVHSSATVAFDVSGTYGYEEAFRVLALLNEQRAANGLSALTLDTGLMEAAMQRAAECSVCYSHTRPNGERCRTVPGFVATYWGENIAVGYNSPESVMSAWMNSEGHRNNILNSRFNSVGLGVFWHGGTCYWAQLFSDIQGNAATEKASVPGTARIEALEANLSLKSIYSALSMYVGDETLLNLQTVNLGWQYRSARIENSSVSYSSSNTSVATVDADGTVTAVGSGTATITISIKGGTQTVSVAVTVKQPVTIIQQPTTSYTKRGKTASVTVKATGDGLQYQWYVKNAGSSTWVKSAVTSKTYSVKMASASKDRQLYCIITDQYGKAARTDIVYLRMAATITRQPASVVVENGEKATVKVTAAGDGLTYRWYFKNKGSTKYTYTPSFKGNTYSVTMSDARAGRQVLCRVYDKYGNVVQTKAVVLSQAVRITRQPASVVVENGEKATVKVAAAGDGLTYRWYFKNKGSAKYTYTPSFKGNTYSVTMSDARAGRQVLCRVYDKYGNVVQTKAVVLSQAVRITKQPVSVKVAAGATAKATVTAVGDDLTYTWYVKTAGSSKWVKSSLTGRTYSVKMTDTTKNRQVYCVVTDKYGNTVKTATVTLRKK